MQPICPISGRDSDRIILIVKPCAVRIIAAIRPVMLQLVAVDFRRGAEGSGAGGRDCAPREHSCTLAQTGGGHLPLHALVGPRFAHQWIAFRVVDGIHCQVNVQVGPAKVMGMRTCDVHELPYGDIAKPGKVFEGEKHLSVVNEEPETVSGYVGDLNVRSVLPTRHGFHPRAPE